MLDTNRDRLAAIPMFLGILALVVAPTSARAEVWLQPQQPLSAIEWLEFDISGADAAGIGYVLAVKGTIVNPNPKVDTGFGVRSITLRVAKWLKGQQPQTSVLSVGVSPEDEEPLHGAHESVLSVQGSARPVFFMLHSVHGGWGLCSGPDPVGAGLRVVAPSELDSLETIVRRIVTQQTPDSLLARADLVFVGHVIASEPCGAATRLRCARVEVDSLFAGTAPGGTVCVFASFLGSFASGPALYVLHATPNDYHEVLGHQAGIQSIQNGQAQLWRLPVQAVRARVQLARDGGVR